MTKDSKHPSFFALDRSAVGGRAPENVAEHAKQCGSCQIHLAKLEQPGPIPTWVRELETGSKRRPLVSRYLPAFGFVAAGALACLLAVVVIPNDQTTDNYIAAKGDAAVGLYIKRNSQVTLWDQKAPLQPGDHIRLKVKPGRWKFVTVAHRNIPISGKPSTTILYEQQINSDQEFFLPKTWELDDAPGSERLAVVFSNAGVTVTTINKQFERTESSSDDFVVEIIELKKSAGRERGK